MTSNLRPSSFALRAAAIGLLAGALLLTGCSVAAQTAASAPSPTEDTSLLDAYDLAGKDVREIITELDTMPVADRPQGLSASIQPAELLLSHNVNGEARIPLPSDEIYLSFAPYISQTHDCTFHVPTGCLGELANTDLHVTITDAKTGERYYDEDATTYDSGFIGYWLPRGIDATVTVTANGSSGQIAVSTRDANAPTCITTLQLTP